MSFRRGDDKRVTVGQVSARWHRQLKQAISAAHNAVDCFRLAPGSRAIAQLTEAMPAYRDLPKIEADSAAAD